MRCLFLGRRINAIITEFLSIERCVEINRSTLRCFLSGRGIDKDALDGVHRNRLYSNVRFRFLTQNLILRSLLRCGKSHRNKHSNLQKNTTINYMCDLCGADVNPTKLRRTAAEKWKNASKMERRRCGAILRSAWPTSRHTLVVDLCFSVTTILGTVGARGWDSHAATALALWLARHTSA